MRKVEIVLFLVSSLFLFLSMGRPDFAPYFYDNGAGSFNGNMALFSIAEDTRVGTHLYTLNGSDPEGEPVTYGMTFDKSFKEYFRVDAKSGHVTLIRSLDREVQDEIVIFVSITDGRNQVVERVSVFVADANDEKPEFLNLPFIVNVPEDTEAGRSIYRVQAVDRDLGSGGSVTYYLQSALNTKFTIDAHSGVLRINADESLDFELSRTHFVTVVAKDGGGKYHGEYHVMTSSAIVTVNVLDAQDSPPIFVGTPYFGFVYEVSVPGSEIITVFAKDGDHTNVNPIHYSILNGSDRLFSINKTSGCISLTLLPEHMRNELYELRIMASEVGPDNQLLDHAITTVTIHVMDLNNHPPTFYGESGPQSTFDLTMYEHPPEGEILRGLKITVNDSDQGANAKFRLLLVGPVRVFRVVPQTVLNEAQVTILVENSSTIDYEKYQFLTFKLVAVEIDTLERFSATADIVINLLDTNDNIPKFSTEFYIARIPENSPGGSIVVAVTATDPDSGLWGEVKYSIYGSGSHLFIIHHTSGVIYTQPWASLDAEVKSKYNFYVKAEDIEGKYTFAEVFVTVLDLNDHPPEFIDNFLEKTMIIGAPIKIEALDEDAEEPNNLIEYTIMKADPDNIFDINTSTGEIKMKPFIKSMETLQNITKQKDCKWSVVVKARDRGSPSFSTTIIVKIDITEANGFKGPVAAFLIQSQNNPMKVVGVATAIISIMVLMTIIISTLVYLRNTKSNRITPSRRIIRRRAGEYHQWISRPSLGLACGDNTRAEHKRNNHSPSPKQTAPRAPVLPQVPSNHSELQKTVPTVSGFVSSGKFSSGCKRGLDELMEDVTEDVSMSLVSELKKKIEKKIMEANQSYYC